MRLIIGFASAVILPAFLITAWYLYGQFRIFEPDDLYIWVRTGRFFSLSLIVSFIYVAIFGVPAYFILEKINFIRWWSVIVSGFILGAIPMAILTWPLKYSDLKTSSSSNGIKTMIDGIPTMAGWLEFLYSVLFFGVCGMVGSLAFWLVISTRKS